jgi:4-hydroxy-4-methyl-2-oxoglutarate aldolase
VRTDEDNAAIRERFLEVETANVADVLDERGLPDQGLAPDFAARSGDRLAGWAFTIAGQMVPYEAAGDPAKMQACEQLGAGEVSVCVRGGCAR